MEEHKFCYLKLLLRQRGESSIVKCVKALSELYNTTKNSYEERFVENISPSDFLETMLVDGCFIVELIRKGPSEIVSNEDDDFIFRSVTSYSLTHDLLLLENQLPFFILQKLFDITLSPGKENNLEDLIFRFFRILPGPGYKRREEHHFPKVPVRHLLELMYDNWLPSPPLSINWWLIIINETNKKSYAKAHIPCATRLHEAGIKFKKAEGRNNNSERYTIFNIKFENGVLEIPKLTIGARTESLLRNLIAYELFGKNYKCHFIEYAKFMDCLINSNKDVELLCGSGIIDNWLGDDEVIASMFNRLLDNVRVHQIPLYSDIYMQVNEYCGGEWNFWKAKLKHDYFNGPWALISFLAAVLLLLFTTLQAVYSVLSYHHS